MGRPTRKLLLLALLLLAFWGSSASSTSKDLALPEPDYVAAAKASYRRGILSR